MSEVAGRMASQIGAQLLEKTEGGKGILLSGVPGVSRGKVVIIGGGTVGTNAAKIAIGLGADVTILDLNLNRLRQLDDIFGNQIHTLVSSPSNIATACCRGRSVDLCGADSGRQGANACQRAGGEDDGTGFGHSGCRD